SFLVIDPALYHISPLSLHDALPISGEVRCAAMLIAHRSRVDPPCRPALRRCDALLPSCRAAATCRPCSSGSRDRLQAASARRLRSEEHTSELQSRGHLVCRLLLEKK